MDTKTRRLASLTRKERILYDCCCKQDAWLKVGVAHVPVSTIVLKSLEYFRGAPSFLTTGTYDRFPVIDTADKTQGLEYFTVDAVTLFYDYLFWNFIREGNSFEHASNVQNQVDCILILIRFADRSEIQWIIKNKSFCTNTVNGLTKYSDINFIDALGPVICAEWGICSAYGLYMSGDISAFRSYCKGGYFNVAEWLKKTGGCEELDDYSLQNLPCDDMPELVPAVCPFENNLLENSTCDDMPEPVPADWPFKNSFPIGNILYKYRYDYPHEQILPIPLTYREHFLHDICEQDAWFKINDDYVPVSTVALKNLEWFQNAPIDLCTDTHNGLHVIPLPNCQYFTSESLTLFYQYLLWDFVRERNDFVLSTSIQQQLDCILVLIYFAEPAEIQRIFKNKKICIDVWVRLADYSHIEPFDVFGSICIDICNRYCKIINKNADNIIEDKWPDIRKVDDFYSKEFSKIKQIKYPPICICN